MLVVKVTFEEFQPINPETLRTRTENELLFILYSLPPRTEWREWLTAELAHRQANRLSESLNLVEAAVLQVERAVKALTMSSEHLEGLTRRLRTLTWILIVLTALALITPIGIEIWHISHIPEVKVISLPPPPQTAPQTPSLLVP